MDLDSFSNTLNVLNGFELLDGKGITFLFSLGKLKLFPRLYYSACIYDAGSVERLLAFLN